MMHGGLVCAVLDEAIANLIHIVLEIDVPTAGLEVRFKRPAETGKKLKIEAEFEKEEKKIIYIKARATSPDGSLIAHARGKFLKK